MPQLVQLFSFYKTDEDQTEIELNLLKVVCREQNWI